MCIVSTIGDYGRRNFWPQLPESPLIPQTIRTVQYIPDPAQAEEIKRLKAELAKYDKFKELIRKAEEMDAAANEPECEDPEKAAWRKSLDDRMAQIEQALGLR